MKNIIQLRNGFVNVGSAKLESTISGGKNKPRAITIAAEMMHFGFLLDSEAINHLSAQSDEDLNNFYLEVIVWLKDVTGSKTTYKPFWKNFPNDVMSKSESELWLHQILHYLTNGHYEPGALTENRPIAFEQPNYRKITAGDDAKYLSIFTSLLSVNSSLTKDDLETIKYMADTELELPYPDYIPFKENLTTLASLGLDVPVKNVTDVLRIAVGMSGGDVSLPAVPPAKVKTNRWSSSKSNNPARDLFKFKKFSRAERKYILGLLEKTNCDVRDCVSRSQRWIRLGEILHPGEYATQFPRSAELFDDLRNHKPKSWHSEVDKAFKTGSTGLEKFTNGVAKLSENPGEFLRKLDSLYRNGGDDKRKILLTTFNKIAPSVSNKVLYEAYSHFEGRSKPVQGRSVMIKGARKRTKLPDIAPLPIKEIDNIHNVILDSLNVKFQKLSPLGHVWIDEELKKIPLPTNMRSLNPSLAPTIRGQRTPLANKDAKVIRAFVHWYDETGSQDIDLTATFISDRETKRIGWNGEHSGSIGCYSGDVRHRKGPCAEYIDIDVKKSLSAGYKYVVLDARNYNGGSMTSVKDLVFGYMEREHPEANLSFVPNTLANCVKLTSDKSTTLVVMFDLTTMEYIFLDIDADGIPVASANVTQILAAIKPYTELPKFSVHDLLFIHAANRGKSIVEKKEDATTSFEFETFSKSYVEILKWMGV